MKRILTAVLAVVLLCGCGADAPRAEQAAQLLAPPFLMTADFTLGEVEGTLVLARPDAGTLTLTFHAPDTAAGQTASLSGDEVTLSFGTQSCTLLLAELPEGHPLRLLQTFFSRVATELPACETGQAGEIRFRFADGSCITAVDGTVRAVELPVGHLSLRVTGLDRTAP